MIQTSPELSVEAVCAWQNAVLESAKEILVADKSLLNMLFVLVIDKLIEPELARSLRASDFGQTFAQLAQGRVVELIHPLVGIPPLAFIQAIHSEIGRGKPLLHALQSAFPMHEAETQEKVLAGLKRALGLDDGDIHSMYIKDFLRRSRALAYISVHESWATTRPEGQAPRGSIRDEPDAKECILVNLESGRFRRVLSLPFERTERDVGDVKGFGELSETRSDDPRFGIAGRMLNLLEPDADLANQVRKREERT